MKNTKFKPFKRKLDESQIKDEPNCNSDDDDDDKDSSKHPRV